MANHRGNFSALILFLIGELVICTQAIQLNGDVFSMRHFNVPNSISRILSYNWTDNQDCLIELNAIKNGLENDEQWAIRRTSDFYRCIFLENKQKYQTIFVCFSCRFVGEFSIWRFKWKFFWAWIISRMFSYWSDWKTIWNSILHWKTCNEKFRSSTRSKVKCSNDKLYEILFD